MNIYEKLSAITAELGVVAKNLNVNGYKAVSERDVIDAVKPIEEKYKIYSYPSDREIIEADRVETETSRGIKITFFSRIKTTYTFVNMENPEEKISTVVFSEGIDPQDKGSGKAMTYADKYALMKAYKISTGEDPDKDASEDSYKAYTYKKSETKSEKKDEKYVCEDCEKEITGFSLNGNISYPVDVYNNTFDKYGKHLCRKCALNYKGKETNES